MCTASWFRTPHGYEFFFNRDELADRRPEEPVARREDGHGPYLAPRDPDGGGTWLGVSPEGWTLALLNGDEPAVRTTEPAGGWRTRGAWIPERIAEPTRPLDGAALVRSRPFVLLTVDPAGAVRAQRWNGATLRSTAWPTAHGPATSSGRDPEQTARGREALLRENLDREGVERATFLAFHRTTGDDDPGGLGHGPCVRREEVATRSLCHVVVDLEHVTVFHALGAPDRTPFLAPVSLPRTFPRP